MNSMHTHTKSAQNKLGRAYLRFRKNVNAIVLNDPRIYIPQILHMHSTMHYLPSRGSSTLTYVCLEIEVPSPSCPYRFAPVAHKVSLFNTMLCQSPAATACTPLEITGMKILLEVSDPDPS